MNIKDVSLKDFDIQVLGDALHDSPLNSYVSFVTEDARILFSGFSDETKELFESGIPLPSFESEL